MKDIDWGTIHHHNFISAQDRAFNVASSAEIGHCVLITGPSGVGKSTILASVLDMLVGPPQTWPEGERRYIHIDCDRETPGAVTRNIAVDLNRALGNPFVALSLPFRNADYPYGPVRPRLNEHDLRESFRVQAALRRTRYVAVDAMENIAPRQEIAAEARFDSIKSLIRPHRKHEKNHEMTLIMVGHYSLLTYWRANAQLARRVTEIPVLPYGENTHDINRFDDLLHAVSHLYPLKEGRSLRDWNDVLFHLSAGSVGLLKKLLNDAIVEMRLNHRSSLDLEDIARAAPPRAKLDEVKRDLDGFWPFIETSATESLMAGARARERELSGGNAISVVRRKATRIGRKAGARDLVGSVS